MSGGKKREVVREYVKHWQLLHDGQAHSESGAHRFFLEDMRGFAWIEDCVPVEHSLYFAPKKKNRALRQRRGRRVDVVCCCCVFIRIGCGGWTARQRDDGREPVFFSSGKRVVRVSVVFDQGW